MKRKNVPVKTTDGMLEMKARRLGLAPRIRTALLLVDGVKSTVELERLMTAAGVTPGALQLLLDKGLIHFPQEEQQDAVPAVVENVAPAPTLSLAVPTIVSAFIPAPLPEPSSEHVTPTALEVVTLTRLETILGDITKLEMESILSVATLLELTPTQVLIPDAVVNVPAESLPMPPVAHANRDHTFSVTLEKAVVPASTLRMNLIVARAHLANALDQFMGIDGYLLKQKVMACESRAELEKLFRLVDGALTQKMDKPAVARTMEIAHALLER